MKTAANVVVIGAIKYKKTRLLCGFGAILRPKKWRLLRGFGTILKSSSTILQKYHCQFDHSQLYPAIPDDTWPHPAQVREYVQPSSCRKDGLHGQGRSDRAAAMYGLMMGKHCFD